MNLHTDKRVFSDIVDAASDDTGIAEDIIEKDYYVTMVLKTVFDMDKDLVFKGGTSLSKAYHILHLKHNDNPRRQLPLRVALWL